VRNFANKCDVMIVVGSGNSSNSVRLAEVALENGSRAAYRVDGANELQDEWIATATTVGLTSGASVPEELVTGVLKWLAERGFGDVEEIEETKETLIFSLPAELRRDLKAPKK
jgi:4-hydroxy-3-methylbut-2-enyl diphosphate reductase